MFIPTINQITVARQFKTGHEYIATVAVSHLEPQDPKKFVLNVLNVFCEPRFYTLK